ncbi:MAG TPA: NIPSNAP family protein [Hyphomicrobiaceae bacterium]|nr:NIPSNAP family protein [Hyphomicrobiaceae bacterium]
MLYELRVYHCVTGRLPALLKRFESVTLRMFEKHGIRQAGFWTTQIGANNNDLHYLLAWESLAEREAKWATFSTDPEWLAARAESERDGPIVASIENTILQPTAFSTVK